MEKKSFSCSWSLNSGFQIKAVICFLDVAKGGVYACAVFSVVLGEFSAPPRMWYCGQTGLHAPCGVQGLRMYNTYVCLRVCHGSD